MLWSTTEARRPVCGKSLYGRAASPGALRIQSPLNGSGLLAERLRHRLPGSFFFTIVRATVTSLTCHAVPLNTDTASASPSITAGPASFSISHGGKSICAYWLESSEFALALKARLQVTSGADT